MIETKKYKRYEKVNKELSQRQFRSRQGRSDKKYSRDMQMSFISYIGLLILIAILLISKI
tara:strand:- start:1460 stop:1639 length:180 start_codon:yes stop_codon:yes gene_type:complete